MPNLLNWNHLLPPYHEVNLFRFVQVNLPFLFPELLLALHPLQEDQHFAYLVLRLVLHYLAIGIQFTTSCIKISAGSPNFPFLFVIWGITYSKESSTKLIKLLSAHDTCYCTRS